MSSTEKMTAQQYRDLLLGKSKKAPLPKPIFTPEVYEQTTGNFVIEVEPMGAPRTTRNSRFNPAKSGAIDRYVATTTRIRQECARMGYQLGAILTVRFEFTMPPSWPQRKRDLQRGRPHQQKPDLDNCVKLVMDAFKADDSHVHTIHACKVWGDTGRIVIHRS